MTAFLKSYLQTPCMAVDAVEHLTADFYDNDDIKVLGLPGSDANAYAVDMLTAYSLALEWLTDASAVAADLCASFPMLPL